MVLLNFEYVNIQVCKDKVGIWTYNSFSVTSLRSFQKLWVIFYLFKYEVFALKGKLPNRVMRPYNLACPWSMAHVSRFGVSRSVEVVNFLKNILSICILLSHERSIFRFSPWGKLFYFQSNLLWQTLSKNSGSAGEYQFKAGDSRIVDIIFVGKVQIKTSIKSSLSICTLEFE